MNSVLEERKARLRTAVRLGMPDRVPVALVYEAREVGPEGFILAQGCCIPPDAKLENVQAMVRAASA